MSKRYLFDASSLIYALKQAKPDVLIDNYIQWLTIYEVLNGLWKEAYLVKSISSQEATSLVQLFKSAIEFMKILDPRGLEDEIFKIAYRLGLTIYDASYIVLADKNKLVLITEDLKLREKAGKLIEVHSLEEIL